MTGQNLENACKAYAYRTRIQAEVRMEKLAGQANLLPINSPEWKVIVAEIVKLQNSMA